MSSAFIKTVVLYLIIKLLFFDIGRMGINEWISGRRLIVVT